MRDRDIMVDILKQARMQKAASLTADTFGVGGAVAGGTVGAGLASGLAHAAGVNPKVKLAAMLMGGLGGSLYGGVTGYKTGEGLSRMRRRSQLRDMIEQAAYNRQKMHLDAQAMEDLKRSGLLMKSPF